MGVQGIPKPPGLVPICPAAEWKRAPEAPSPSSPSKDAAHQTILSYPRLGFSSVIIPDRTHGQGRSPTINPRIGLGRNGLLPCITLTIATPLFTKATASCPPNPVPAFLLLPELPSSPHRPLLFPNLRKLLLTHFTQLPLLYHSNRSSEDPSLERPSLTFHHSATSLGLFSSSPSP